MDEVERQKGDGKIATPGAVQMVGWTVQMIGHWAVQLGLDNPPSGRRGQADGAGQKVSLGSKDFGLGPTIQVDSHGRTTSGGEGGDITPPYTRIAPNGEEVVRQVYAETPDLIYDNYAFTVEVARRLNLQDPNWGLNGKRGNPNDPSQDAIAYRNPEAPGGVEIYDIILDRDGPNPKPAWTPAGGVGVWLDPWG